MDELYDLSKDDLRMMRKYLDDLSGSNRGDMPGSIRGENGTPGRREVFRTIMDMSRQVTANQRFDTKTAWEKVSARIGRDEH